jgi:hypothetical protein
MLFIFKPKKIDLRFRNRPYFFDSIRMHLNQLTPNLNLKHDVPSVVPVWVHVKP